MEKGEAMGKKREKRRIVLVPLTLHGHITPILQLGKALSLKGFSITVFQGQFNRVNTSSPHYSGFQFLDVTGSLPESELMRLSPVEFLMKQNKMSEANFKTCIGQLLVQQGNDIACIIYDEFMSFCGATAEEYKLPSFIFTAASATHKACQVFLSKLNAKKFLMEMEGQGWYSTLEGFAGLMGARNIRASLSPLHAEMEALLWAMECMKNLRQFQVTFATDCSQLVKMVSEPEEWPAFASYLEDFNSLRESFSRVEIIYVSRTHNKKADSLARSARKVSSSVVHMDQDLPVWFTESI